MAYLIYEGYPTKLRQFNRHLKAGFWFFLILVFTIGSGFVSSGNPVSAQQSETATPTMTWVGTLPGRFITVTNKEPINVRTGPSSFDYPVIGTLPVGATALATGRSQAGEWIEIEFQGAPRGKGWIYAANVTLSDGPLLPIVEPPPTPAPLETPTLNPTYVAAFQILPTSTRLPTFTAPPPLVIPTYENPASSSSGRAITLWVIALMGVIGIAGFLFASIRRR
jgi:hypothetical protein